MSSKDYLLGQMATTSTSKQLQKYPKPTLVVWNVPPPRRKISNMLKNGAPKNQCRQWLWQTCTPNRHQYRVDATNQFEDTVQDLTRRWLFAGWFFFHFTNVFLDGWNKQVPHPHLIHIAFNLNKGQPSWSFFIFVDLPIEIMCCLQPIPQNE